MNTVVAVVAMVKKKGVVEVIKYHLLLLPQQPIIQHASPHNLLKVEWKSFHFYVMLYNILHMLNMENFKVYYHHCDGNLI